MNADCRLLALLLALLPSATHAACVEVAGGNGQGTNSNQLTRPSGVSVAADGSVIVADAQRLTLWTEGATTETVLGSVNNAFGLLVDKAGRLVVSEWYFNKVSSGLPGGARSTVVGGTAGSSTTQFDTPLGLALDKQERLYVADRNNHRVLRFDRSGDGWSGTGTVVAGGNGQGSLPTQLYWPSGVTIDADGSLLVADQFNGRVMRWTDPYDSGVEVVREPRPVDVKLDERGVLFTLHTYKVLAWEPYSAEPVTVAGHGGMGSGLDQMNSGEGLFLKNGSAYIADYYNHRVLRCDYSPPTTTESSTTSVSTTSSTTVSSSTTTATSTSATTTTSSLTTSSSTTTATTTSTATSTTQTTTASTSTTSTVSSTTQTTTLSTTTSATSTVSSLTHTSTVSTTTSATSTMTSLTSSTTVSTVTSMTHTTITTTTSVTVTVTSLTRTTTMTSVTATVTSLTRTTTMTSVTSSVTSLTHTTTMASVTSTVTSLIHAAGADASAATSGAINPVSTATSTAAAPSTTSPTNAVASLTLGGSPTAAQAFFATPAARVAATSSAPPNTSWETEGLLTTGSGGGPISVSTSSRAINQAMAEDKGSARIFTEIGGLEYGLLQAEAPAAEGLLAIVEESITAVTDMPMSALSSTLRQARRTVGRSLQASLGVLVVTEVAGVAYSRLTALEKEIQRLVLAVIERVPSIPGIGDMLAPAGFFSVQCRVDVEEPAQVADLLSAFSVAKSSLAGTFNLADDNVTFELPTEGTFFSTKLSAVKPQGSTSSGGKKQHWVNTTDIKVYLPPVILSKYGGLEPEQPGDEVALSCLAVKKEKSLALGVLAAAVLEMHWLQNGSQVPVHGLPEPILFSLPLRVTDRGMRCVYWDEVAKSWSTQGVSMSKRSVPGGDLWCETTHLSLFGAILESIVTTVLCTNLKLFTLESLRQIVSGNWYKAWGSMLLWLIIAVSVASFIGAAILDSRRRFLWNDSFLLVTKEECPEVRPTATPPAQASAGCSCPTALCGRILCMLMGSPALKEALDDIVSRWFENFADLRSIFEGLCTGLELDGVEIHSRSSFGAVSAASRKLVTHGMMVAARRATAASLGLSPDLVSLILTSEEMARYITAQTEHQILSEVEEDAAPIIEHEDWRLSRTQSALWSALRKVVAKVILEHVTAHSKPGSMGGIAKIFLHQNPLGDLFVLDIFQSCKQKVAVMIVELWGSFTLSGLFFQATGSVRGKPLGGKDTCGDGDDDSFAYSLGRSIVIALGSLLTAGLPVLLLESLQTKSFKVMECGRDSEAWRRQLRAWRLQERLFWCVALIYILACSLFLLAFLANISEGDHLDWSLVAVLTLLQDFLLLPLFIASALSAGTRLLLRAHGRVHQVELDCLVRQVRELLHRETNVMLAIERL